MNDLVTALLETAGFARQVVRVEPMSSSGVINKHDLVEVDGGVRYVARTYGWPFDEPETVDRQAKEEWLLPLLRDVGVPVPEVVASVPGAILTNYIDGDLLASVPEDRSAWADAGRTLALAHEIAFDAAGLVVAGGVEPFREGTWGAWQAANCEHHAQRLAAKRPDLRVDPNDVGEVLSMARQALDAAAVRLVHTDSHPWNVLVRDGRCVAWLDWEFAWAADRTWDFVRNELVRITDIGPTPKAFYQGYGSTPDPALFGVCELALYLWMANDSRYFNHCPPTYAAAERYVSRLPEELAKLGSVFS